MGDETRSAGQLSSTLLSIVPFLTDFERKEFFNYHYWRFLETLKECAPWVGGRVLDIGIAPGHVAMALKRLGCEVCGITDHEGLARGRRGQDFDQASRWQQEGFTVRCAVVDREPIPFPGGHFDLVVFTEVLEHLVYDPKPLVHEMFRVMKRGGGIVVSTPNASRIENRIKGIMGRSLYPRPEDFYFDSPYKRHNREYTLKELIALFQPPFVLKNARCIMLGELAVPVSERGTVYDTLEYAEITPDGRPAQPRQYFGPGGWTAAARSFLRLLKGIKPSLRSGLLATFTCPARE